MAESMSEILNPSTAHRDPDFPDAPPGWSRASAEALAQTDGLALDPDHWDVVRALQGWFADHAKIHMRELHDALDERFHAKGGLKYLYGLLPGGPVAQGCRLAGLEAPAGAADRSFGSVQ
jgi:tRNA 2-thiouridine synthesizing protein E